MPTTAPVRTPAEPPAGQPCGPPPRHLAVLPAVPPPARCVAPPPGPAATRSRSARASMQQRSPVRRVPRRPLPDCSWRRARIQPPKVPPQRSRHREGQRQHLHPRPSRTWHRLVARLLRRSPHSMSVRRPQRQVGLPRLLHTSCARVGFIAPAMRRMGEWKGSVSRLPMSEVQERAHLRRNGYVVSRCAHGPRPPPPTAVSWTPPRPRTAPPWPGPADRVVSGAEPASATTRRVGLAGLNRSDERFAEVRGGQD